MWCAAKGINCPDCGVFGECQKSCCGLPNAEPSTLGTSSSYLVNTTSEKLITEQEKEIERLKTENCELTKKLEARLTCDFVKTAQKQAQIEVLNRLKSLSIYDDNYLDGYVFIDDIEKLLEELKK